MGDFNIDILSCTNSKWNNLAQLFDLSQTVIRPTHSTSTIIDHVYTTNTENITKCFVPHYAVSYHYPVCLTRKVNHKLPKAEHITTTYRCFKKINENAILSDLAEDLQNLELNCVNVDYDLAAWHSIMINQLDMHRLHNVELI